MTVKVLDKRMIEAEEAETPWFSASAGSDEISVPSPGEGTVTQYVEILCEASPEPYLGRPVVRKLPADWPYPPEEGYGN